VRGERETGRLQRFGINFGGGKNRRGERKKTEKRGWKITPSEKKVAYDSA